MPTASNNIIAFTTRRLPRPSQRAAHSGYDLPLRVLIIDDSPEDRMVVRFALEAHGFLLSEADSGERGLAAAASLQPDCIVLDYHMPDLNGLEVLGALRRPDGTMPYAVVTLTGSGDPAQVNKLLQAGALDYVSKQHLDSDNLPRAVQGAVERFRLLEENRRAELHNAQLAAIITASADAIFSFGLDHIVQSWNPGAAELFGYSQAEAVGQRIDGLIVPAEKAEERARLYATVATGQESVRAESVRRHKDGTLIPVDITVSPMLNNSGVVVGVSVVMRDMREQKSYQLRLSAIQTVLSSQGNVAGAELLPETRSVELSSDAPSRVVKVREAELLDALRDEEFDQITRLASTLLNAPVSLMTVIDEKRQFFVSSYGLGEPVHSTREKPLGTSYCRYVIESGQPVVIHDASQNPLVSEIGAWKEGFVSYLAVPVLGRDGVAIASLSVAGSAVRVWTRQEQALLDGMAKLLMRRLETREAVRELRRSEQQRRVSEALSWSIFESSPNCVKLIDADGRLERINVNGLASLEIDNFRSVRGVKWLDLWPSEERAKVEAAMATAHAGGVGSFTGLCPTVKGTRKWWEVAVNALPTMEGSKPRLVASSRDVTAHRAVEQALRQSESRYRNVFDHAATGIVISDGLGRITDVNASFCSLLGYTQKQLLGVEFQSLIHPDDREANLAEYAKLVRGEIAVFETENRYVHKDGHSVEVRKYVSALPSEGGEDGRTFALVTDITQRNRNMRTLAQQAAMIDLTADAVIVRDQDGMIASWNSGAATLYGFTAAEAVGSVCHALLNTRYPMPLADIDAALERDGTWSGDLVHRTRDGREVTVLTRWQLEPASMLHQRRVLETNTDITERKQAETALRTVNATFRHLVENSPFGIYTVNADFRLVQVSVGARKVFNNIKPLLGRDFAEIMRIVWPEPLATEIIRRFRHTLATGEPFGAPSLVERRHDTDDMEAYDWKIERITLPDGRPGVVCHFYDLSERQRHEEHVHLLMREVNHRSKNLLGVVQAVARHTAATSSEGFVQRFGERIQALSANQDLLVKSDWIAVPVEELVRAQLAHFDVLATGRVSIKGPPVKITAAASQSIGMALHELATNAAKYGSLSLTDGRVEIVWGASFDAAGEPQFSMRWSEAGGPPVSKPERRGFGTTVIDGMVKMTFGGPVNIDYAPAGLVWSFTCSASKVLEGGRLALTAADAPPKRAAGAGRGRQRVLVVEDEPLMAMEIAAILTDVGLDVLGPVASVSHALALIESGACDAAVLDTNLGEETSEPIARRLSLGGTPFVIVSGYAREQQPTAMGDAPLLVKPLQPELLVAAIKRCLSPAPVI